MAAETGRELLCRSHSFTRAYGGRTQEYGVLSFYASRTLPEATSVRRWLELIEARCVADAGSGRLAAYRRPTLQILGDREADLPGAVAASR
jgi:hypothetical protein